MLPIIGAKIKADLTPDSQKKLLSGTGKALEPFGIGWSLISDQLAYYRLEHLINIVNKATKLCEKNNINPKPISKKFLSRFIEEASFEDEPEMQQMWANLLASECINGNQYKYISILKELDNDSAKLLNKIYDHFKNKEKIVLNATLRQHQRAFGLGQAYMDIQNCQNSEFIYLICYGLDDSRNNNNSEEIMNAKLLDRLGLIELSTYQGNLKNPDGTGYAVYAVINLTGKDFIEKCSEKN